MKMWKCVNYFEMAVFNFHIFISTHFHIRFL
jgi:hypothetical protein